MKPNPPTNQIPVMWDVTPGRRLMGPLPDNRDLVDTISSVCRHHGISLATFSVQGNATRATLGVFDPQQQVYVTAVESFSSEIVHCSGTITGRPAAIEVLARIAIADEAGNLIGGRLFSETLVLGAEIHLQEWLGSPMNRHPDPQTGLAVLNRTAPKTPAH